MKKLLRFAALPVFMMAAGTQGAGAVTLMTGSTLNDFGFTFSVTSCQVGMNSGTGATHSCVAGDNLELTTVSTGRGTLTVEISGLGNSAALTETATGFNAQSNLIVGLSVGLNPGYGTNTTKAINAQLTTNGVEKFTNCTNCTGDQAHASAALSGVPSTLTANLALQNQNTTLTTQTVSSLVGNFTTSSNSFTITETLNLTNTRDGLGGLKFNYARLTFHTAPEPASIGVMLLGLGGLAYARRRRAS